MILLKGLNIEAADWLFFAKALLFKYSYLFEFNQFMPAAVLFGTQIGRQSDSKPLALE